MGFLVVEGRITGILLILPFVGTNSISKVFVTFQILERNVLGRASAQLRSRIWNVAFC